MSIISKNGRPVPMFGIADAEVVPVGHSDAPVVADVEKAAHKLAQHPAVHDLAQGSAHPLLFTKALVAAATAPSGAPLDNTIQEHKAAATKSLDNKTHHASNAAAISLEATPALTAAAHLAEGEKIPKNILSVAGNVLGKTVGPAAQTALHQGAAHADRLALGVTAPVLAQIGASKTTDTTLAHAFDSGLRSE